MSDSPLVVPEEVINEAKEAFALFDKDSLGSVKTKDLGMVLRSLGFSMSATELREMELDADPTHSGSVHQAEFLRQVTKAVALAKASNATAKKSIKLMVERMDFLLSKRPKVASDGTMLVEDFKRVVTRVGEKLSQEEFEELSKDLEVVDGRIHVEKIIQRIIS